MSVRSLTVLPVVLGLVLSCPGLSFAQDAAPPPQGGATYVPPPPAETPPPAYQPPPPGYAPPPPGYAQPGYAPPPGYYPPANVYPPGVAEQKFRSGRAMRRAGVALTIVGPILMAAGLVTMVYGYAAFVVDCTSINGTCGYTTTSAYGAVEVGGGITFALGVGSLGAGIPLMIVGRYQMDKAMRSGVRLAQDVQLSPDFRTSPTAPPALSKPALSLSF